MDPAPDETFGARMRRGDVFTADCPSRDVMRRMTASWSVLVLIALQPGTLRFSQVRDRIGGISDRMLAKTMRDLAADGLVVRRAHPAVPPHVDYTLTELGQEAAAKVAALADWVEGNIGRLSA